MQSCKTLRGKQLTVERIFLKRSEAYSVQKSILYACVVSYKEYVHDKMSKGKQIYFVDLHLCSYRSLDDKEKCVL